jgi:hypothetical protein
VDRGLPSPERRTYGHTLTRLGRNDDALAFWRKILADDPNDEVAKQQIEKLTAPPPAAPPKVEAPAPAG